MLEDENAFPMVTFSLNKDDDDEVEISLDWADEFDLLPYAEQYSFLLQMLDVIEETLAYVESAMDDDDETDDDDKTSETDETETE